MYRVIYPQIQIVYLLHFTYLLHCTWSYKSEEFYPISTENSFHKHKENLGEVNREDAMLENHLEIFWPDRNSENKTLRCKIKKEGNCKEENHKYNVYSVL